MYYTVRLRFYLNHWGHWQRDRETLSETDIEMAKVFFKAMSKASEADVKTLATKYLTGKRSKPNIHTGISNTDIPRTDKSIAAEMNMTPAHYRLYRIHAESRLDKLLQQAVQDEQQAEQDMWEHCKLMLDHAYLLNITTTLTGYTIKLVFDEDKANVFPADDAKRLADEYGFTPVNADKNPAEIEQEEEYYRKEFK